MNGETKEIQKAPQVPINIDMSKGVLPANYSEVMQMAALIHNSGLAPKSLDTVQKVAVAMMMAMEVGLPVVTGIQHVAVINGKAGIWGDATIALVRASGMMAEGYPKETESGQPYTDAWTFKCTVKRRGGSEATGSFSWADAKKAGLDNPQLRGGGKDVYSPWTRFPKRMMQWKARQWVYRDEFGDVLRGMKMAEELYDYIDMEKEAQSNGSYHAAAEPPPEKDFDYDVFRTGLITNGFSADDIDAFEQKLCEFYQKTPADIRGQIGADPENFVTSLTRWAEKNGTSHEPTQEEPPSADFIRDEFINLRTAGYSTWVHKNKGRIATFPDAIQAEIRDKWAKMYQGIAFPLDNEDNPLPEMVQAHAAELAKTNGNGPYLNCPINQTRKSVKVCEICNTRDKCQTFQEWQFENTTA